MSNLKAIAVDDSEIMLYMIESLASELSLGFENFTNPINALDRALACEVDIIFVDYIMPQMSGIEFITRYRCKDSNVPIIMITSSHDDNIKIAALEAGATDFLTIPFNTAEFKARVTNILKMSQYKKSLENQFNTLENKVQTLTKKIHDRERETLLVLAKAAEFKNTGIELHTERVGKYAKLLAKKLGLDEKIQDIIYYSAQLHDIGKIGIPDYVLLKEGKYTDDEYNVMKAHTEIGFEILKNARSEYLTAGKEIALYHHEWYDGNGYPYGKKSDEIPIEARIVAVADVFDALTTKRTYKDAWDIGEAFSYILKQRGRQFDPEIAATFVNSIDEIRYIYEEADINYNNE